MSRKDIKEKAQELIMQEIANTKARIYEGWQGEEMREEDKQILMAEIQKQSNRIAKIFGYSEAWFN